MIRYHALVITLIVALAGCATQPRAYDPTAGRALNLAKAAGLSEGGWAPPMVLDHGKALLFIEPTGHDEDAPRPMVLGGSDGAAGHEDSDQGAAS